VLEGQEGKRVLAGEWKGGGEGEGLSNRIGSLCRRKGLTTGDLPRAVESHGHGSWVRGEGRSNSNGRGDWSEGSIKTHLPTIGDNKQVAHVLKAIYSGGECEGKGKRSRGRG